MASPASLPAQQILETHCFTQGFRAARAGLSYHVNPYQRVNPDWRWAWLTGWVMGNAPKQCRPMEARTA